MLVPSFVGNIVRIVFPIATSKMSTPLVRAIAASFASDENAALIANELLNDSRSNGRRREETAGMNLHADIFIAQEQWESAIVELEAVLAITEEIGDTGLEASARAKMALALLETNQLADAEAHIDAILAIRPPGADVLRLQARVAALRDDPDQAVVLQADRIKWSVDGENAQPAAAPESAAGPLQG